jgi:hypothetical protein
METWEQASKSVALMQETARESSLSWPAGRKLKQALADRLLLSEAIDAVAKMVDAYPNGRASITDSYLGNMANMLCQYPRLVALQCADPIRGVPTKSKFIPTIADVVEWCDPRTNDMQKTVSRDEHIEAQLRAREEWEKSEQARPAWRPDRRANLFVGEKMPRYAEMVERSKKEDQKDFCFGEGMHAYEQGIWVPLTWWHERKMRMPAPEDLPT